MGWILTPKLAAKICPKTPTHSVRKRITGLKAMVLHHVSGVNSGETKKIKLKRMIKSRMNLITRYWGS
jgi:hypothetical protein